MKSRKVKVKCSVIGKLFYWLQFMPMFPVLIASLLLWLIGEIICNGWTSYRKWFLGKFTTKISE